MAAAAPRVRSASRKLSTSRRRRSIATDLRHRERMVEYAASHVPHMQKALMQMNVQLHHVVSDITGVTGLRIIRAIVAGVGTPAQLATFRDIRCGVSEEPIREALEGNYRAEHVFALKQALE